MLPDTGHTRRPRRARKAQPQTLEAHPGSWDAGVNRPDRVERRWTALGARMGYTRDDCQRAEILAAIDQMTWTVDMEAGSLSFLTGPAIRAIVSAVITRHGPECALGSARVAPFSSGRVLVGVQRRSGERHYLLDLRGETIHVMAEIPSDEPTRDNTVAESRNMPGNPR